MFYHMHMETYKVELQDKKNMSDIQREVNTRNHRDSEKERERMNLSLRATLDSGIKSVLGWQERMNVICVHHRR